jgi:hypothetical protein
VLSFSPSWTTRFSVLRHNCARYTGLPAPTVLLWSPMPTDPSLSRIAPPPPIATKYHRTFCVVQSLLSSTLTRCFQVMRRNRPCMCPLPIPSRSRCLPVSTTIFKSSPSFPYAPSSYLLPGECRHIGVARAPVAPIDPSVPLAFMCPLLASDSQMNASSGGTVLHDDDFLSDGRSSFAWQVRCPCSNCFTTDSPLYCRCRHFQPHVLRPSSLMLCLLPICAQAPRASPASRQSFQKSFRQQWWCHYPAPE